MHCSLKWVSSINTYAFVLHLQSCDVQSSRQISTTSTVYTGVWISTRARLIQRRSGNSAAERVGDTATARTVRDAEDPSTHLSKRCLSRVIHVQALRKVTSQLLPRVYLSRRAVQINNRRMEEEQPRKYSTDGDRGFSNGRHEVLQLNVQCLKDNYFYCIFSPMKVIISFQIIQNSLETILIWYVCE